MTSFDVLIAVGPAIGCCCMVRGAVAIVINSLEGKTIGFYVLVEG